MTYGAGALRPFRPTTLPGLIVRVVKSSLRSPCRSEPNREALIQRFILLVRGILSRPAAFALCQSSTRRPSSRGPRHRKSVLNGDALARDVRPTRSPLKFIFEDLKTRLTPESDRYPRRDQPFEMASLANRRKRMGAVSISASLRALFSNMARGGPPHNVEAIGEALQFRTRRRKIELSLSSDPPPTCREQ